MRRNPRRAEVDPQNPRGWATSDRNGHIGNLHNMKWQMEWRGSTIVNTRVLVHEDELDIPQRQLGTLVIPPDPPPLMNARPENYSIDEQPVSTRYTIGPDGYAKSIRVIINNDPWYSNRIVTCPGGVLHSGVNSSTGGTVPGTGGSTTGVPFESDGASAPWTQTPIGPNSFVDSNTGLTWITWERGLSTANKRLAAVTLYNSSTNAWSSVDYVAATNTLTADGHGVPVIAVDNNSYGYFFYGSHNSAIKVAATGSAVTSLSTPVICYDLSDISGTHTFPNPTVVGGLIYLLDSTQTVNVSGGAQGAIEMMVCTPSSGALSVGTAKRLFDCYNGIVPGWIPICQAVASGTDVHFVFCYGTDTGQAPTAVYYAVYDTLTGNVRNYSNSHAVVPGSQPINLTDMNSFFKIATEVEGGFPALAIDSNGVSHVAFADGSGNANAVGYYMHASGGGAFSTPASFYAWPVAVNAFNVDIGVVPGSAGEVNLYFGDGSAGYTFPLAGDAPAGNIYRVTRSSGGTFGSPTLIMSMATKGLDFPTNVGGNSQIATLFTEVTSDYTAMSGALKGYAYGGSSFVNRTAAAASPQLTSFLARTSGLDALHTAAYTELINGLVSDGILSLLDGLYIFSTTSAANALLNLCGTSFSATNVGSASFTADQGFKGWSNTTYLDTGFNPVTSGGNWHQNSASMGMATQTNSSGSAAMAQNVAVTGGVSYLYPRYLDGKFYANIDTNTDIDPGVLVATSIGMWSVSRTISTVYSSYRGGVVKESVTQGSALFNGTVRIGGGTPLQGFWDTAAYINMAFVGGGLTSVQMRGLYNRVNNYMQTIGLTI